MTANVNGVWTDAMVDQLRRLIVVDGRSAGEAAADLGVSRNTVLGKCRRLGLQLKGQSCRPRLGQHRTPPAENVSPPGCGVDMPPPAPTPKLRVVHVESRPRTILTIGADMCRWPLDHPAEEATVRTLFCGLTAVHGSSYCAAHHQLGHQPTDHRPTTHIDFSPGRRNGGRPSGGMRRDNGWRAS